MSDTYKAPKTISDEDETRMVDDAHRQIDWMSEEYPDARPIDVVNAYLRAFNERVSDGGEVRGGDDLRSRSFEEWLVEWFSMPDERWIPRPPADKMSADLLHALDVDGWEIRRKGAE